MSPAVPSPPPEGEKVLGSALGDLDPRGEPRLAFLRRAPAGLAGRAGPLLCLSASFNPLTAAHVWLIQEAGRLAPPDEVLLLLATANADKTVTGLPLERRLGILLSFVGPRPTFSVAAVSHGRFLDKARAIRPHYPEGTALIFLVGFDTLIRVFDPKYYADPEADLAALFASSQLIVANRAPDPPEAIQAFLGRPEVSPYAARIRAIRLPAEIATVSATRVRTCLARGEPVADLVPSEILPLLGP